MATPDIESDQAAFNVGISYLQNIHMMRQARVIAGLEGNRQKVFNILTEIFSEIAPFMTEQEYEYHISKESSLKEMIIRYRYKNNIYKIDVDPPLKEWTRELNKFMQDKGMVLPKRSDPRYALGGGNF